MLVDVIFLELVNDFTLLFCVFSLLEEFSPIGYEFDVIDEVYGIFDILGHLANIGGDEKIRLAIDDNCPNQIIKFDDMSEGNLLDSTLIVLF